MSALDAILLAGAAAGVLGWLLGRPGRRVGGAIVAALIAGSAWQLAAEGPYWQFAPLYVLIGLLALAAARARIGWPGLTVITLGALASVGAWAFLAAPALPTPRGPYTVGTVTWRWVDAARPEDATDDRADRRNVIVQAWYPAAAAVKGPHSPYLDGLGRLPARVYGLPGGLFESFRNVDTHAVVGVPPSEARAQWPVIIFSPGYGAPRAFYTSLVADLASRGFIVLALDHPYESALTELADGRLVTPIERSIPGDPNRVRYMEMRVRPRVGDVRFTLDRLQQGAGLGPLTGRADLHRVAVIGHSFGGATAALVLAEDPRPRAGADIDGMLYGGVEGASLRRPFLVLESDHAATRHPALYDRRVEGLLQRLGAPGRRVGIAGAGHLSFTDGELFFAPPVRPLVRRLMRSGGTPAASVQRRAADELEAFLKASLGR